MVDRGEAHEAIANAARFLTISSLCLRGRHYERTRLQQIHTATAAPSIFKAATRTLCIMVVLWHRMRAAVQITQCVRLSPCRYTSSPPTAPPRRLERSKCMQSCVTVSLHDDPWRVASRRTCATRLVHTELRRRIRKVSRSIIRHGARRAHAAAVQRCLHQVIGANCVPTLPPQPRSRIMSSALATAPDARKRIYAPHYRSYSTLPSSVLQLSSEFLQSVRVHLIAPWPNFRTRTRSQSQDVRPRETDCPRASWSCVLRLWTALSCVMQGQWSEIVCVWRELGPRQSLRCCCFSGSTAAVAYACPCSRGHATASLERECGTWRYACTDLCST